MQIVPSILNHEKYPLKNFKGVASRVHLDVMDGVFVKQKSYLNSSKVGDLKTSLIKDVHLMTQHPNYQIGHYAKAGCKVINVHLEVGGLLHLRKLCDKYKVKMGIAINPETSINKLEPYLDIADEFLVMSVHPGKGGQKFLNSTLTKVKYLRSKTKKIIKVDGGIRKEHLKALKIAGVDIVVIGSYLFEGDPVKTLVDFKKI